MDSLAHLRVQRRFEIFLGKANPQAPDIAGQGIANPIGSILSVAMMARYSLGLTKEAASVERAVDQVLANGSRTADIAVAGTKTVSTTEMGDLITAAISG